MPQDTEGCAEFEQEPILSPFSDHGDLEDTATLFKEFERDRTISPLPQDTEDTAALFKEFEWVELYLPCHRIQKILLLYSKNLNEIKLYLLCHRIEEMLLLPLRNLNGKKLSHVVDASMTGSQKLFESTKENFPPLNQLPFTPLAVWRTRRKKRKRNLYGHT